MAKAQYKLGTFISFTHAGTESTGVISGIMTRAKGYSYETNDTADLIDESNILNAYRPIVTRAKKAVKKEMSKKKSVSKENSLTQ